MRTSLPFCSRSFLFLWSSLPHVIAVNPGSDPVNLLFAHNPSWPQQRKPLVHEMRLGDWSPVDPWDPFPCLCQNSLPFFCGEEHLQQLLTIIPGGVVNEQNGIQEVNEALGFL